MKTYEAGVIGVDAGLCWIGDPCYILHKDEEDKKPRSIGKDWMEFCGGLPLDRPVEKQFHYDMGHEGLGFCVSTGYGDGVYPVFVTKNDEGRIAEITVQFIVQEPWEKNEVQFARLLSEINAVVGFSDEQLAELRDAMDLTEAELDSLFDRAGNVWAASKEKE